MPLNNAGSALPSSRTLVLFIAMRKSHQISDRMAARLILTSMNEDRQFIDLGLQTARDALSDASGLANLHLRPSTIRIGVARRFRQSLRIIESTIRRLIILLAASLKLEPLSPARAGERSSKSGRSRPGLMLMPVDWKPRKRPDFEAIERLTSTGPSGPVDTAPLLDRMQMLFDLIKNPYPVARRLARRIEKLKALRLRAPTYVAPQGLHRFGAEFGLIASALPELLSEEFRDWYDTG